MPDSGNGPFTFGDGPDACLLLHGFTGAPSEMRPLGERLARAGMRVHAPLLPGHGVSAAALRAVSREEVREAAWAALESLRGARRLFVAGLSAGAMLSIELAAGGGRGSGLPEVNALALLAPAVRFAGTTWLFAEALGRIPFGRYLPIMLNKGARDVKGEGAPVSISPELRSDGSLARVPLSWGRELRLLSQEAMAMAPLVRAPTIILQGEQDRTAAPIGVPILAARLGARDIEVRRFPESGHVLPIDRDGPEVCDAVAEFFARGGQKTV